MELLKKSEADFKGRICDAIGVAHPNTPMRELNKQLDQNYSPAFYELMRRFNERCPHEFGSAFYEPFSVMRMATYFHDELEVAVPQDYLASDYLRMPLSRGASELGQNNRHLPEINLNFPKGLKERLTKIYAPSNTAFAEITGIDLSQYGYQMQ
jgi:hypothetical protein